MAIVGIFHPVVSVSDMARSLPFYRDALGLSVTFDDHHDPEAISALFGIESPQVRSVIVRCPDESEIELVEYERPRGRPRSERAPNDAGILAINLRVTEIDALVARILAGGYASPVRHRGPDAPRRSGHPGCGDRRPDGETIILVQLPEGRGSLGG